MEQSQWLPVVGYEGLYEVSNCGHVRRTCNKRLKTQVNHKQGYLVVYLSENNRTHGYLVHRLVAEAFIGPLASLIEVNHIDGVKTNNNVTNLELVTRQQNIDHAVATGLIANKGENNPQAKLTADQVCQIRRRYTPGGYRNGGPGYIALAGEFNLNPGTIRDIIKNKIWRHIER
jgi:hypothetical protein